MDPHHIANASGSLMAELTPLNMFILMFVSKVRIARKDMDAVLRELASLHLCLTALKDDDLTGSIDCPQSLKLQISQALSNTKSVVQQLAAIVTRPLSNQIDHGLQWTSNDRREIVHCRSLLETNRMALNLAVTMSTLSKMVSQHKTILNHTATTGAVSGPPTLKPGLPIPAERNLDSSFEASQLDSLKVEIADFRGQLAEWSGQEPQQTMRLFKREAHDYTASLLEDFPSLHTELTRLKRDGDVVPAQKCLEKEAVSYEQLQKERAQFAYQEEEIARLQEANRALEVRLEKAIDDRVLAIGKEKDMIIDGLRGALESTAFYAQVVNGGLEFAVDKARRFINDWDRSHRADDPSFHPGAPDGDISDTTTVHAGADQRRPRTKTNPSNGVLNRPTNVETRQEQEKLLMEFSVNYAENGLELKSLRSSPIAIRTPVVIHKDRATVADIKQEILRAAAEQSPPLSLDFNPNLYYITNVSQCYDTANERPTVQVQALPSSLAISVVNLRLGDKLRLMAGPSGRRLDNEYHSALAGRYPLQHATGGFRQNPIPRAAYTGVISADENLPEVLHPPKRTAPRTSTPIFHTSNSSLPVGSLTRQDQTQDSGRPEIVVSHFQTTSDYSQLSVGTGMSRPAGLRSSPLFAFRVDRSQKLRLRPKYLVETHLFSTGDRSMHCEHMLRILQQVASDRVHFMDEDPTDSLRRYTLELLSDLLAYWKYDPARVFLQVHSTILRDAEPIRAYNLSPYSTVWVMLKPLILSGPPHLGHALPSTQNSSTARIPQDHELLVEEPNSDWLKRVSFRDGAFKANYTAHRHSLVQSSVSASANASASVSVSAMS